MCHCSSLYFSSDTLKSAIKCAETTLQNKYFVIKSTLRTMNVVSFSQWNFIKWFVYFFILNSQRAPSALCPVASSVTWNLKTRPARWAIVPPLNLRAFPNLQNSKLGAKSHGAILSKRVLALMCHHPSPP